MGRVNVNVIYFTCISASSSDSSVLRTTNGNIRLTKPSFAGFGPCRRITVITSMVD